MCCYTGWYHKAANWALAWLSDKNVTGSQRLKSVKTRENAFSTRSILLNSDVETVSPPFNRIEAMLNEFKSVLTLLQQPFNISFVFANVEISWNLLPISFNIVGYARAQWLVSQWRIMFVSKVTITVAAWEWIQGLSWRCWWCVENVCPTQKSTSFNKIERMHSRIEPRLWETLCRRPSYSQKLAFSTLRRLLIPRVNMNAPIRDALDCSLGKPMRRQFVSGFPRALCSLSQEKSSGVEFARTFTKGCNL